MCHNRVSNPLQRGFVFGRRGTISTSPLRITAGVCVLAAGLLLGAGGAIASADPGSDGGASSGSTGASEGSSATDTGADASSAPSESATNTQSRITRRIPSFTRLSPTRQGRFHRPTTIVRGGIVRGGVDVGAQNRKGSQVGTATAAESESEPTVETGTAPAVETGTAPAVEAQESETAPATQELATETEPNTGAAGQSVATVQTAPADASATSSNSGPIADATGTPQAATAPVPPTSDPVAPRSKSADPLTNAFVSINGAMTTWSESLAALPTSQTPIRDVITSLETMVTTVVGAVTRMPGDFYAMLGMPASAGPPQSLIGGSGSLHAGRVGAPADGPFVGPHAGEVVVHTVAPAPGARLFGTMAPRPQPEKVASSGVQPLSVSGTVPLKPAATPVSAKSIFEHVIEAVLVPASLTALAAMALPGVGALLVVAAAGVRVGYRQAKAGLALRASGIARFAGPGPLGIARSASMVVLRQRARGPRTKRAVCPEAERTARTLERVA